MYTIKVLSNKDFDDISRSNPRYSYVDETNLGFADRELGVAYVRNTHIHDLNKYLINHELEELESDSSTHEDPNGIRHKKFFKEIFAPYIAPVLAAFVPGIGPALSAGIGLGGQIISQKETAKAQQEQQEQQIGQLGNALGYAFGSSFGGGNEQPQTALPPLEPRVNVPQASPFTPQTARAPEVISQPPIPALPDRPSGGPITNIGPSDISSSRIPTSITGNVQGTLGSGLGQPIGQNPFQGVGDIISPELSDRLKGFYAGRLTF